MMGTRPMVAAWTIGFAILGAAWGGFLGMRHVVGLGSELDRVEMLSLDWRYDLQGTRAPPRGVVIAAIDEATIAEAGAFPLPRSLLASIVRGLAAGNPQAVAIDVLLLDPGPPGADRQLADALRSARTVIGAAAVFDSPEDARHGQSAAPAEGGAALPKPAQILSPQPTFQSAARSGLTNVSTDRSGVPRYVPLMFDSGGTIVPSFALATAAAALNSDPVISGDTIRLAGRAVATDLGYNLPLRFYGPRGSIRTFSAIRAVKGELDPDEVRGQIVVLGATAAGAGDSLATPFDRATPGVEILATAINNLLAGDSLVRNGFTRRVDASVAVLLPIAAVLLLAVRRVSLALALTLFAFALWIVATYAAFLQGYWLGIAVPAAAAVPVAIGYGMTRLLVAQRAAHRFASESDALRQFQPPQLIELLARDPQFLATPVRQDMAIVFVDLTGSTGVTESLGPAWTRELLVALHERIEAAATEQQGFVARYMGDGAMILFGLPAPRADDAGRALRAVTRLHESLSNWLAALPPAARDHLGARVGAHFGPVVLSRLGAADHQEISPAGDTVNVASRLLEVAKEHRAAIAVSEDLYRAARNAGNPPAPGAEVAAVEVAIRGRAHPIMVRLWSGGAAMHWQRPAVPSGTAPS
jgi:adenylate cyclase